MYNVDPQDPSRRMVFTPRILKLAPGDTVTFIPENRGHNSQSTKGMIPEGAEPWKGAFGKPVSVTPTVPGLYGYDCMPHRSMGMVGLLIVEGPGMLDNLSSAKSVRQIGRAKSAWEEIWAEAEQSGLLTA